MATSMLEPPTVSATPALRTAERVAPAVVTRQRGAARDWLAALLPALAITIALLAHRLLLSRQTDQPTRLYPRLLMFALAGCLVLAIGQAIVEPLRKWFVPRAPLLASAALALLAWDLITLKFALMPLPYFPGPDMVLQSLRDDYALLLKCAGHSLLLLATGYVLGTLLGVTCGVMIGWSRRARYWGMPVLKVVGPIPATAFIPLALMLLPTAFTAAVSLIALAVWFPVTMLTSSGIANVRVSLLDVARTLGASRWFLIFRVAIPAALPSIFVGLFMGLGAAFLTLIVAETVGVNSGLGWYVGWARVWADYAKVYAALIIMAVFFSGLMTLLFTARDRVLVYQKGVIKW